MMTIVTRTALGCHNLQVTYDADSLEKKKVIKLAMQEALNMTVRHTRALPCCLRARMRACVHGLGQSWRSSATRCTRVMAAASKDEASMLSQMIVSSVMTRHRDLMTLLAVVAAVVAAVFQVDASIPMFVFLGRLDAQKGVDVMFESIDKALEGGMKAQFVTMGSGIEELEEVAADLEDKYPANFRAVLSFKGNEKYKTYAAADFALMPSRYEPCGLVQMESMRFGTLPIVSPTGGLADTVSDMRTGFVMEHEVDQDALAAADVKMIAKNIERAARVFAKTGTYSNMQKAAMKAASGYSWSSSAQQYIQTFAAIGGGRE